MCKPEVQERTGSRCVLYHQGLTKALTTHLETAGEVSVHVEYPPGELWDIVADFDVSPQCTRDGRFFCGLCEPPKYYGSEMELWERHSLEPWRKWLNEVATEDHEIRLCGGFQRGATAAVVIRRDEYHIDDPDVHTVLPVLAS